jgi:hypothetical protein
VLNLLVNLQALKALRMSPLSSADVSITAPGYSQSLPHLIWPFSSSPMVTSKILKLLLGWGGKKKNQGSAGIPRQRQSLPNRTLIAQQTRGRTDKLESFCTVKETVTKLKK